MNPSCRALVSVGYTSQQELPTIADTSVRLADDLFEIGRVRLFLIEDMPELVMYRFEVGGVESIDIARIQRIEVVEGDFRTALGRTQYDGAVVVVGRAAHEEEVFREVGPDEVPAAGDFVVGLRQR